MPRISEAQLTDNIQLVKWEHEQPLQKFNLLTVHSLLIDSHPKFIELKTIVHNHNNAPPDKVIRIKQKHEFVSKLYTMLCELVRIPTLENQQDYLDKVYDWAKNEYTDEIVPSSQQRPRTASTRTRPLSAYSGKTRERVSRIPTATTRPGTTSKPQPIIQEPEPELIKTNKQVDYDRLQEGDREFYTGARTLHNEYGKLSKRLKEYQRKVFYEDEQDSDIEPISPQKIDSDNKSIINIPQPQEDNDEGQYDQELQEGEIDVNVGQHGQEIIDDFAIGDDQPDDNENPAIDEIEEVEVVDKLRPKIKVYHKEVHQEINSVQYYEGEKIMHERREQIERNVNEDKKFVEMKGKWAKEKSRHKQETKRRAESARMGIDRYKIKQEPAVNENFGKAILVDNIEPITVHATSRPITAFNPQRNTQEIIKKTFINGKIEYKPETINPNPNIMTNIGLTAYAPAPNKRPFEDILREAEERVRQEAQDEVFDVKESLVKHNMPYNVNRIAKSMTYHAQELPEGDAFIGQITGMSMIKNPFFKVAKKKKKKKKK